MRMAAAAQATTRACDLVAMPDLLSLPTQPRPSARRIRNRAPSGCAECANVGTPAGHDGTGAGCRHPVRQSPLAFKRISDRARSCCGPRPAARTLGSALPHRGRRRKRNGRHGNEAQARGAGFCPRATLPAQSGASGLPRRGRPRSPVQCVNPIRRAARLNALGAGLARTIVRLVKRGSSLIRRLRISRRAKHDGLRARRPVSEPGRLVGSIRPTERRRP